MPKFAKVGNMREALIIFQAVLAFVLTFLILTQLRGSGMAKGQSGTTSFSRRGIDKFVFRITFVTSGLFLLVSIFSLLV